MAGDIQNFMRKLVSDFTRSLTGIKLINYHTLELIAIHYSSGETKEFCFDLGWDYVIISAADTAQKECFEHQIKEKLLLKEIPNLNYLVISDPAGPVLGSGGSTMHILKYLYGNTIDGENIDKKRILMIHAGGFSKRLPSLSCTGKLFSPLPLEINSKSVCFLTLKLIVTSPFLKFMNTGGLFITCSDDLETFTIEDIESFKSNESGVTAIAHPSSTAIGENHGVYVTNPICLEKKTNSCWISSCLEVMQKPTLSEMISGGAVIGGGEAGEQIVYTDSMFWCGPNLVKKMVEFATRCEDLYHSETCIFGDFIGCMGTRTPEEKLSFKKIKNVAIKNEIARLFHGTSLEIMVLEKSRFYHLGTMPEYLENLLPSAELFQSFGMKQIVGSHIVDYSGIKGVVTNSLMLSSIETNENSVIDHCIIDVPVVVESNTILSNCIIDHPEVHTIPTGWLFHTSAVRREEVSLYVTIAFRVEENLKTSTEHSWSHLIGKSSLWSSQLFEAKSTMSESFFTTWKGVWERPSHAARTNSITYYSMEDIVKYKNIEGFVEHRRTIATKCDLTSK